MSKAASIFWKAIFALGLGAILVAFSEILFYEISDNVGVIELWLIYSLMVCPFLPVFIRDQLTLSPSAVLAGSSFGFLAEGLFVSELFSGLPLTLLWTSLAWHLSVSVVLGLFVFTKSILEGRTDKSVVQTTLLGAYLGLWNSYIWTVQEQPGNSEVSFDWSGTLGFIQQLPEGIAFLCVGIGLVFFAQQRQLNCSFGGLEKGSVGIIFAIFAAGELWISFPFSLILPLLLLINTKMDSARAAEKAVVRLGASTNAVSWLAFLRSLFLHLSLFTLGILGVYLLLSKYRLGIEMNAVHILTFGPYSLYLWGEALRNKRTSI